MSRKEIRHCDRCGAEIQKDTGIFIGGEIHFSYAIYYGTGGYSGISGNSLDLDLCPDCVDKLKGFLNI